MAHQTDWLLVLLAEDLQLLLVKQADVSVPASALRLVGLGCDLEGQVDGRPPGDGGGAADGTFPAAFQLPELVQAHFADVVAALQQDGKAVDVGALGAEKVVFAEPGGHPIGGAAAAAKGGAIFLLQVLSLTQKTPENWNY